MDGMDRLVDRYLDRIIDKQINGQKVMDHVIDK